MEKKLTKILWLLHQNDDGIEVELTTMENCLTEINELRRNLKAILTDLEKFKGMKAYNGEKPLTEFETKYIEDAVMTCENQLNVRYVYSVNNEETAPTNA
jgi:hypothetical protein